MPAGCEPPYSRNCVRKKTSVCQSQASRLLGIILVIKLLPVRQGDFIRRIKQALRRDAEPVLPLFNICFKQLIIVSLYTVKVFPSCRWKCHDKCIISANKLQQKCILILQKHLLRFLFLISRLSPISQNDIVCTLKRQQQYARPRRPPLRRVDSALYLKSGTANIEG